MIERVALRRQLVTPAMFERFAPAPSRRRSRAQDESYQEGRLACWQCNTNACSPTTALAKRHRFRSPKQLLGFDSGGCCCATTQCSRTSAEPEPWRLCSRLCGKNASRWLQVWPNHLPGAGGEWRCRICRPSCPEYSAAAHWSGPCQYLGSEGLPVRSQLEQGGRCHGQRTAPLRRRMPAAAPEGTPKLPQHGCTAIMWCLPSAHTSFRRSAVPRPGARLERQRGAGGRRQAAAARAWPVTSCAATAQLAYSVVHSASRAGRQGSNDAVGGHHAAWWHRERAGLNDRRPRLRDRRDSQPPCSSAAMIASASASEWGCRRAAGGAFPLAGCHTPQLLSPAGVQAARVAEGRRASLAPGAAGAPRGAAWRGGVQGGPGARSDLRRNPPGWPVPAAAAAVPAAAPPPHAHQPLAPFAHRPQLCALPVPRRYSSSMRQPPAGALPPAA